MRLVLASILMLSLCGGIVLADPAHVDEKPWSWPDGMFDYRDTYAEQEPNDTCPGPMSISCGDVVRPAALDYMGDWDWYPFTLDGPYEVTIGTDDDPDNPMGTDTYLELYAADCTTYLTGDDDSGPGYYSLIQTALGAGDYHIKCRGYGDVSTGSYMMFLTCVPSQPPPENDTCEGAEEFGYYIDRCTMGSLQGDNSTAINNYSPANDCTGYSANGKDVVYYMDLQEGDYLDMCYNNIDWDSSFYILTDCSDMYSCVAGADDTVWPDPECFTWTVPETGRYYLILDAWSSDQGGPWWLEYSIECACDCEVVVNEILNLGNGRCKYLFTATNCCDLTNDLHLDLVSPANATIVGCSVDPGAPWHCDVDGNTGHFWADGGAVDPCEPLPELDLVLQWDGSPLDDAVMLARFTLDGVETCRTEVIFPYCEPVPTRSQSWGHIKSMFR
jgi:hypothetical protein